MPLSREAIQSSGTISPTCTAAVAANPISVTGTDILSFRASRAEHLKALRHLYPIPGPIPEQVVETDHQVPVRDGSKIAVRVYEPKYKREGGSPLILAYHEGGWSMGDLTDEEMNCRMWTRDLGAVCINVEYRLAPEHPFPTAITDSWDALLWAISHAQSFNANLSLGLIVEGASAGGNIAAVMAHMARDAKLEPPVTGQYLCAPAVLHPTGVPEQYRDEYWSREGAESDPVLKKNAIDGILAAYNPDPTSWLWEPFNHPAGHIGVAKAYIQIGGIDPLRDETLLYERELLASGVETKLDLYAGYGHMFHANFPTMQRSRQFWGDMLEGMRWLLER
ncbi:alpha/beta-hydrolase [Lophium mytilinum]|uniref:Alpha/beta-hydrolase n=1 Tax=Lophium mytilinum TaxID=390894 RepID=A0A6A6QLQ9_9PEZI|nr:alpha/beta-hydrolase [Lophium mytilinum]